MSRSRAMRRIRQAMMLGDVEEATARRAQNKADRTHVAYVKHFYNLDIHDPRLYHLMIESTTNGGRRLTSSYMCPR